METQVVHRESKTPRLVWEAVTPSTQDIPVTAPAPSLSFLSFETRVDHFSSATTLQIVYEDKVI